MGFRIILTQVGLKIYVLPHHEAIAAAKFYIEGIIRSGGSFSAEHTRIGIALSVLPVDFRNRAAPCETLIYAAVDDHRKAFIDLAYILLIDSTLHAKIARLHDLDKTVVSAGLHVRRAALVDRLNDT